MSHEVNNKQRYDVFLSFHGGEDAVESLGIPLSDSDKDRSVRQLARLVESSIHQHCRQQFRVASVFLDERLEGHLHNGLADAILQLRGNGVALCLLTRRYFQRTACVAELQSFREMDRAAVSGVEGPRIKVRFICLEETVDTLLDDFTVQSFLENTTEYKVHQIQRRSFLEMAHQIADIACKALTDPSQPTILGPTLGVSFLDLAQNYFTAADYSTAKEFLERDEDSILDVLLAWKKQHSLSNFDALENLATLLRRDSVRLAVQAFQQKWIRSDQWDWSPSYRVKFQERMQEARQRIQTVERNKRRKVDVSIDESVLKVFDVTRNALWTHQHVARLHERVDALFMDFLGKFLRRTTRIATFFLFTPPTGVNSTQETSTPLVMCLFAVGKDSSTGRMFRDWAGSKSPSKPFLSFPCSGERGKISYLSEAIFVNGKHTPFAMKDPKSTNHVNLLIVPLLRKDVPFGAIQLTSYPNEDYKESEIEEVSKMAHSVDIVENLRVFDCHPPPLSNADFLTRLEDQGCFWRDMSNLDFEFLVILDIDNFKDFNKTSLLYGDHVLRQVGQKLQSVVQYPNKVYRYGGDEFCLLIRASVDEEIQKVILAISSSLNGILDMENRPVQTTASFGYAKHRQGMTAVQFFQEAEQSLKHAKHRKAKY